MIVQKWNDPDCFCSSCKYPHLHKDYKVSFPCDQSDVSDMGLLTAEKAKDHFIKMKAQVVITRTKWMASGQGEGSMRHKPPESYFEGDINNLCTDKENEEVEEFDVIDGNDKAKFLQSSSSAILYLWECVEYKGILDAMCQQLSKGCSFDMSNRDTMVHLVRQLEEFDAMIFELEYKIVDKNTAIGSRMYELMTKRIEQLKRKIAEVEGDQKEVRRKANETTRGLVN